MKVDEIEIHVGSPDFKFRPLRALEAKCEAATVYSGAPSMDEINTKLREMAAGLGANAVINVAYTTGVSWTSWRSMRATGLAVQGESDEKPCPVCAEMAKRAAVKCRFCGAELMGEVSPVVDESSTPEDEVVASVAGTEPLRATNNPQHWMIAFAFLVVLGLILMLAAKR